MATPTWLAATTGQTAQAGQANQLLGTHNITFLYTGLSISSQATPSGTSIGVSNGPPASGFRKVAQSFATGSGTGVGKGGDYLGYVGLSLVKVGNGCDLSLSLCKDTGGLPGTALNLIGPATSVTIPADFISISGLYYFPLPAAAGFSASTTYWVTLSAGDVNGNNAGDSSNYIAVAKSNQVTGAATYSTIWASVSYGFVYYALDVPSSNAGYGVSQITQPLFIYEDGGTKWTGLAWTGPSLMGIQEYTLAEGSGTMRSLRGVTISNNQPTGVS